MKKKLMILIVFGFFLLSLTYVAALSAVVHVPEKYTDVQAGERFYFEIDIKYPENPSRKDLRLSYEILTEDGESIAESQVLKAMETQASFIDFIVIPESAEPGLHIIKVAVSDYSDLSEEIFASFHVVSKASDQFKIYFLILLGAVILVGLLVIASIFVRRKR